MSRLLSFGGDEMKEKCFGARSYEEEDEVSISEIVKWLAFLAVLVVAGFLYGAMLIKLIEVVKE